MARYVITLVHGTFARNARWTKEGSHLRTYFKEVFGDSVSFVEFPWSGWNTHAARSDATNRLRHKLEGATEKDCRHYIIGHSHGGNVALYAAGHPELQDRISGVVCLNTPFFAVFKRNTTQLLLALFPLMLIVFLYLVVGAFLIGPLQSATVNWPKIVRGVVWLFVAAAFGTALSVSIVLGWVCAEKISEWIAVKRQAFVASIALPENRKVPVLCLWAAGDEVISWFQLFDTLAELPQIFLAPIALIIIFLVFFVLQLTGVLAVRMPGFEHLATDPRLWSTILASSNELEEKRRAFFGLCLISGMAYTAVVAVALMVLGLLLNFPFRIIAMGTPAMKLAHNALVRVAFTPVPISSHHVEFCDLESQKGLLSHSKAYNDRGALQKVVDWMTLSASGTDGSLHNCPAAK